MNKCKYTSDIVKLELLESQCLPIILYGIECLDVKNIKVKEINSWWNSIYRRIFKYNKWESVKTLICNLGCLDVHHIVNLRRLLFVKRLFYSNNKVMADLMYYYAQSPELQNVQNKFNIQLLYSTSRIKSLGHDSFVAMRSS